MPKNLENASEFRLFVYELTESKMFGGFVLFVILLNTVILVVQTDEGISIKGGTHFYYNTFIFTDIPCSLVFCSLCNNCICSMYFSIELKLNQVNTKKAFFFGLGPEHLILKPQFICLQSDSNNFTNSHFGLNFIFYNRFSLDLTVSLNVLAITL